MKVKIIIVLLAISLVLSIFLGSLKFVMFDENFYKKEFSGNEDSSLITKQILDFFNDQGNLPGVFDKNEKAHLEDVKNLVNKGNNLLNFLFLCNIALLSLLLFYSDKKSKDIGGSLICSGIFGIIILLPFVLFNFSDLFLKFHFLFFPQGNWQFPYDSILIQTFPEQFFYNMSVSVMIISAIIFVFLLFLGIISSKVSSD